MKLSKTIVTFLLLFFSFSFFQKSHAQSECPNSAIEYLSANKVRGAITGGGDFFWNRSSSGFTVPFSPGELNPISPILVNALWLGGVDEGGTLKVACQTYGNSSGISDFWPGPIDESTFSAFDNGCQDYDRIWKTNRGDILQTINDFDDNGSINDPLPPSILSWPAKGNPHFEDVMGFALPNQELAPFFDRNANGIYEPLNGEYPIIGEDFLNVIPDEMTWTVFNDIYSTHGETGGIPIGAEVHFMAYAFNCSEANTLNYTVFTRHKIINRSPENFNNFKVGIWSDSEIGCLTNNYEGCDTSTQTGYKYIGDTDNIDPFCNFLAEAYEESYPVLTATFLNQKLSHYIIYNNAAFNNPPIATTDPTDAPEFYNYLSGKWRDNTPMTFSGDGYSPVSTDFVNHIFHDNPNEPLGWSIETLPSDLSYDRRSIMSTSVSNFPSGGQIVLDAAFSYHRDVSLLDLENVDYALSNVNSIRDFYTSGMNNECIQFTLCETDCVWPGDASRNGIAKNTDLLYLGIAMGQNIAGLQRIPESFIWAPQQANNWTTTLPGNINTKNADFSGDGQLDSTDVAILELNYRKTKPGFSEFEVPAQKEEGGIYIEFSKDEVSTTSSILQRRVNGNIQVASEDNPIPHLYGIAFTIKFDTSFWEESITGLVDLYDNTFFGTPEDVMTIVQYDAKNGWIEIAISRKDGQAIPDAHGKIGRISLALREDASTGNSNGMQTLSVELFDVIGSGNQENLFQLNGMADVVIGTDLFYDNTLTDVSEKLNADLELNIFPNPNNGEFNLFFEKTNAASQINVFDFSGKNILLKKFPAQAEQLNIDLENELASGIYFIKWTLDDGQFITKKFIVK